MTDSSKKPSRPVVTRFAPSPTGFMHVGGVRTALFAWAYARKNNGTFILRFEDTDKEREVEGSIEHIIESLKWLGLNWDEGPDIGGPNAPYIQSQRLDSYKKYARTLIEKGLAYADPYSVEELEAFRKKAEEEKRPFLYRDHRPDADKIPEWIDEDGKRLPLRLKITDIEPSKWNDLVRGELTAGPEALDDFILIKSDGYPTYNFAHIIDDLEMNISHIVRADEFISSTPKFLALYKALGIERPEFATMPPIMGPDGKKKLGKRDGAKDILAYRAEGFLPEAMMNFLAFIGWNPGDEREIMTPEEFIAAFDFSQVQSAGGKLNEEKLVWTNKEHLSRMSDKEYEERLFAYMHGFVDMRTIEALTAILETKYAVVLPIIRERMTHFGQIKELLLEGELSFISNPPQWTEENRNVIMCPEKMAKNGAGNKVAVDAEFTKTILSQAAEILAKHEGEWTKESVKETIWPFAEHEGRGIVLWPLRVSLSGKEKSPDPFSMAEILGKEETVGRIVRAIESFQN